METVTHSTNTPPDVESARPLPTDFPFHYGYIVNTLAGTLHKAELEYAAALIVRWHKLHSSDAWIGFSREDIATLFNRSNPDPTLLEYGHNPFWQPDPMGLVENGYVDGWEPGPENAHTIGRFTDKFFEAVAKEWTRRSPSWSTLGRAAKAQQKEST
jgi:hypothetical protein